MRCRSMCISAADAARSSTFRAHAETNRLTRSHCPAPREFPSPVTVVGHVVDTELIRDSPGAVGDDRESKSTARYLWLW